MNDPVVLRLDDRQFWLSIADNNMLMWARAIGLERGWMSPCMNPMYPPGRSGAKAEDVVASLLGDWVRKLPYFGFDHADLNGIPLIVQRSGIPSRGF